MMPCGTARLIGEQMTAIVRTSGEKKSLGVLAALAVALFGARNAASAIVAALNIAYGEEQKRGFLKVNLLALALTLAAVVLAVLGLFAVAAFVYVEALVPHLHPLVWVLFKSASYLIFGLIAAAAAATLYRVGPSRDDARWIWLTPGSALFALAWVALTLGSGSTSASSATTTRLTVR